MDMSNIAETLIKFSLPEKLRQRLSQRPACSDAAAELYALSRQLESDNLRTFAASCAEGVAACEGTAENPVAEAEALVRSARLHMEEEKETYDLSLPTMWDSLYFAIDCISKATGNSVCHFWASDSAAPPEWINVHVQIFQVISFEEIGQLSCS